MIKVRAKDARPAGRPDECFYCHRPIGGRHSDECVTVVRYVKYLVTDTFNTSIGTVTRAEPASWGDESMLFARNEGTWCTGNMLNDGSDLVITNPFRWRQIMATEDKESPCLCASVTLTPICFGAEVFHSGESPPIGKMYTTVEEARQRDPD